MSDDERRDREALEHARILAERVLAGQIALLRAVRWNTRAAWCVMMAAIFLAFVVWWR